MVIITGVGLLIIKTDLKNSIDKSDKIKIVTSFYPIYVATANVVADIDNIELTNLTDNQTGCLHDYQLTTSDMAKIETADVFIINGAGMENYIEEIIASYPEVLIIDTSKGIDLLKGNPHHHEDHSHDDIVHEESSDNDFDNEKVEHGEYNPHLWLNTDNYLQQIENIKIGLLEYDQVNELTYSMNAKLYTDEVKKLKVELEEIHKSAHNKEVVIFHDSFAYLADEVGFDVIHTVILDSDTSLSAGDIASVIDEVNKHKIRILLTEEQFSDSIPLSIAKETDAKVYTIDSCVTGEFTRDSYLKAMKSNIEILKKAIDLN